MFFGATGTFVSAMVKSMRFGRLEHVATHSACMVAQHFIKVVAFGLLGFNYGPYAGLVVAMIASGFVGTVVGKHVLVKMKSEEHTSELQSLMRISYAVFCLKKKKLQTINKQHTILKTT